MGRIGSGRPRNTSGFLLLEALVTILILAFGLLGLAGLQAKVQVTETESYQRAQALLLVQDMTNRISANRKTAALDAASYAFDIASPRGSGDATPATCPSPTEAVTGQDLAQLDLCEWSNALKGVSEKQGSASVGGLVDARGCIERTQSPFGEPTALPPVPADPSLPSVYRVTVVWQGLTELNAPFLACGKNSYGAEGHRRAVAGYVTIANLTQ